MAGSVQGTRQLGRRRSRSPPQVRMINRREVTPDDACRTSHEKGRPCYLSDHFRLAAIDRRAGRRPSQDRSDIPTEEGPSTMSPHNDRCTSKATVSPDQDQPDMAIATFSSSRPVVHSSTGSIRRVRRAHHRTQATVIICSGEEQNHPLTEGVKGTAGNSRPGEVASSCQYWGRRRYGPVA